MLSIIRQITGAAALLAFGTAQAGYSGVGSLTFSSDLLGALDTGKVSVVGYGAAVPTITKDTDGYYTQATVSAPITTLTVNTTTNAIVAASTTGGATQTAPVLKSVSSGGSLTVTDLNVDLVNKKVYATLIGGNGVGTLNNFYLWDIGSITGATSLIGPGSYTTIMSGLSITADGFNKFTQSLGLLTLGRSALAGVTDFGAITSTITSTLSGVGSITIIPEIPEPSSYALMTLGLVGVVFAAKRRQKA